MKQLVGATYCCARHLSSGGCLAESSFAAGAAAPPFAAGA